MIKTDDRYEWLFFIMPPPIYELEIMVFLVVTLCKGCSWIIYKSNLDCGHSELWEEEKRYISLQVNRNGE
jgi:hypothetical protein